MRGGLVTGTANVSVRGNVRRIERGSLIFSILHFISASWCIFLFLCYVEYALFCLSWILFYYL